MVDELRERCETIRNAAAWHTVSPGELYDWLSAAAARADGVTLDQPSAWGSSLECLSWTLSLRLGEARAVLEPEGYAELVDGLLDGAEAVWLARRGGGRAGLDVD